MGGDPSEIYDDLMRFKPEGMTPNAWAMKAGVSRTVWTDMRRHGNPSRRTLEKLLEAAGSSLAEFEALRIAGIAHESLTTARLRERSAAPWGGAQHADLPLLATAVAGEWGDPSLGIELTELRAGELVDRVPRPVSLSTDSAAYAITIVGDSMLPRFRPGRRVAVSPRAPIAVGDDVLVKLKSGAAAGAASTQPVLIKELVRKTGTCIELRQFQPPLTFGVPASQIDTVEKILGELI
jgi:phage repressor protein C with HTH and peptisase S24 domain